jgi:hypothetical protein
LPKAHIEVVLGMSVNESRELLCLLASKNKDHVTNPIWEALYDTMVAAGIET